MTAYFFCETTSHILTTYFISKVYLTNVPKVVFLQQGRPNVSTCCEAMKKVGIWDKVIVVPELVEEDEAILFYKPYRINSEDAFYFFTYHSVADRCLYYLIENAGGALIATDEAGSMVERFQEHKSQILGTAFCNLDFNKIKEIWMYDFSTCTIQAKCKRKKIDLTHLAENQRLLAIMREDIKLIFSIKEESFKGNVIFFDQPLAQVGYISYDANQYTINMVYDLLSPFGLIIKSHPGELHPESKYSQRPFSFLTNTQAPWEAIYFVNYYGKEQKRLVFVTYASLAVTSIFFMFGVKNIKVIFLHRIVRQLLKVDRKGLFESADLRLAADTSNMISAPNSFYELAQTVKELFGQETNPLKTRVIDETLFEFYLKNLKRQNSFLPNYLTGATLQYFSNGALVYSASDCWPYENDDFTLSFQCPENITFDRCYLSINNNYMLGKIRIDSLIWKGAKVSKELDYIPECRVSTDNAWWILQDCIAVFRVCNIPDSAGKVMVSGKWSYIRTNEELLSFKDNVINEHYKQISELQIRNRELQGEVEGLEKEIELLKNRTSVSIYKKFIAKFIKGRNV